MNSVYNKFKERFVPGTKVINVEVKDFKEFCDDLHEFANTVYKGKEYAPLISPAFYNGEEYRRNENVSGWSFLCLDFDANATLDEIALECIEANLSFCQYTTPSCKPYHHKFRLILPFARDVRPDEMNDVWAGAFELFSRRTDEICKDKSRGYYVPGRYIGAYYEFRQWLDGEALDPDLLITLAPPPVVPVVPTVDFIFGKQYNWTGVADCPFVKKEFIDEYMALPCIDGVHYHGSFKLMCRIAMRAAYMEYEISTSELSALAQEVNKMKHYKDWMGRDWIKEAQRAIDWTKRTGKVERSALEKLRYRIGKRGVK